MPDTDPQGPEEVQESAESQPEAPQAQEGWRYDEYLQGIDDPQVRELVEQRLEQFRKDSDSQANKKIQDQAQQLKQYEELGEPDVLRFARDLHLAFLEDPVGTIGYVNEEFERETGRKIVEEFMNQVESDQAVGGEAAQETATPRDDEGKALTRKDVDRILEEERQKAEEAQQAELAEMEAIERTEGWLDSALSEFDLDVPQRDKDYIVHIAADYVGSGQAADGKGAIELAVEEFNENYGDKYRAKPSSVPKVATGGAGVTPPQYTPTASASERREQQVQILKAYQRQ